MLYYVLGSPPPVWGQGEQAGSEGSELGYVILYSVGARGVSWV